MSGLRSRGLLLQVRKLSDGVDTSVIIYLHTKLHGKWNLFFVIDETWKQKHDIFWFIELHRYFADQNLIVIYYRKIVLNSLSMFTRKVLIHRYIDGTNRNVFCKSSSFMHELTCIKKTNQKSKMLIQKNKFGLKKLFPVFDIKTQETFMFHLGHENTLFSVERL